MLRVALCISGQMRTFRQCHRGLKKHVLDPLNPDVFVHTWSNSGYTHHLKQLMEEMGRVGEFEVAEERVTYETLDDLYAPSKAVIEDFDPSYTYELEGKSVPESLKQAEPNHCKGALPMYFKIKRCNDLKSTWEQEHNFKYDLVIRLRPDLMFQESIPAEVIEQRDILWYEEGGGNPSYQFNDKFALSNSEFMDYYTSVWDHLDEYWREPLGDGTPKKYRVGERLMMHHMSQATFPTRLFKMRCRLHRVEPAFKHGGFVGFLRKIVSRA